MKKSIGFFLLLLTAMITVLWILPAAAAPLDNNEHNSVEEQIPAEEANATPLVNEQGEEIAFEIGETGTGNSVGGIVAMLAVVGVCLFFCGEGVYSSIKKSRKRREEMFQTKGRE